LKTTKLVLTLLPTFLLIGLLFSCKNTKKAQSTAKIATEVNDSKSNKIPVGKNPPKQYEVPLNSIPPASAGKKAYLATGPWTFLAAVQPSDSLVFKQFEGKKLIFKEDLTFDIYQENTLTESGKWNFDSDNSEIYLSSSNPYLNTTWKVMEKYFTMIWIGQTSLNASGIQLKINCPKN
jgi:hypothetical protein